MTTMDEWLTRQGGLANRLYLLRVAANITARQLAGQAGWGPPKVSKIENGRQMPTRDDITTWARICNLDPSTTRELLALLDEALSISAEFRQRMRIGQPTIQRITAEVTANAHVIRNVEATTIPGLLQTEGYARSRLAENVRLHGADPSELEAAVAARLARQAVLTDTRKRFDFILTEACLRLLPCSVGDMRIQLEHLEALLAAPADHIHIGIVPFGVPLASYPQHGWIAFDDLVAVETVTSEQHLDGDQAATYLALTDELLAESVTGGRARELVRHAMAALRVTTFS